MSALNLKKDNVELTIVVNTCDLYCDVLSLFFAAFSEYWPDCKYKVVINAEHQKYTQYDAVTHNYMNTNGVSEWGDRVLQTLNSIDSEYVLMLYDDFILENRVNLDDIQVAIKLLAEDADAAVAYLINTSLPCCSEPYREHFSLVKDSVDYRLNSAPAIWRRSDLSNYIGRHDNPWAWEVFGSYRTFGDGKNFYTLTPGFSDIYPYNYKKGGAIYRGRWVREVIEQKFKKYQLDIDPCIRGYSEDAINEARSFKWKIQFMLTGYQMVGFKSLLFIARYFKAKFHG